MQTGLYLGRAFAWNARHTQQLETVLAQRGALPIATDSRGGHPALHAVGKRQERPLVLPWAELVGHTLLTGTTRSGKSRTLEVLASEAIRGPGAVVVIDPKGDRDLLARVAAEAHRQERKFALLTTAFPALSATMNPLATATTPAEVATRIQALMPTANGRSSDPFYTEYPLALIEQIAAVQHALGIPWTLENLYVASVLRRHLESLVEAYLVSLGAHNGRGLKQAISHYQGALPSDLIADALIGQLDKPQDYLTKVTSNLIPAFRGVVHDPLGPLFSPMEGNTPALTWDTIVENNMVVYLALSSMLLGDTANRIGRIILQDLVGFLGRRYAYEDMATVAPMTVIIDELRDVLSPPFLNALNKGGGAMARFILAQQSSADMDAALGKDLARVANDNLNTKVYFRLADDRTAEDATEGLGLCTVQLPETALGLGYGGVGGLSGSSHRRIAQKEVPLVRPTWLTALPRGEAFMRCKGEVWKLRVPLLEPVSEETLEATGLTAIWQSLTPQPEKEACDAATD